MTNNPLIEKYNELYGRKEPPKIIKAENTEVKFELKEEFVEELKKVQSQNSVATGGITGITKSSFPKLKTYDTDSANDAFLQISQKIKDGTAKVTSVSLEVDAVGCFSYGKKITFEVYDYEP